MLCISYMLNFHHKFIELFTREFCNFSTYSIFLYKQTFPLSEMHLSQKVIMMWNYRRIFYVKPNISADFEI